MTKNKDQTDGTDASAAVVTPRSSPEVLRARAETCGLEIQRICDQPSCRIQPVLQQIEPIGNDGSRGMVSAAWVVVPNG